MNDKAALEAILFVAEAPIPAGELAEVLELPAARVNELLEEMRSDLEQREAGVVLREVAGGWRLYSHPDAYQYLERFSASATARKLSSAALETLAVIAYKQPVTRSRISAVRGVNCDGVVRTLLSRGLIKTCGTEPETGAHLYRTTSLFLEKLGLDSLDQLPPLAPLLPENLEEIPDEPR